MSAKLHRIGVTNDCPVHSVTVGGFNFPRRTERVTGHGAETRRDEVRGAIVELQEGDMDRIKAAADKRIVRSTRQGRRAQVYHVDQKYFRPNEADEPVSKYLYAEPISAEVSPYTDVRPATLDAASEPQESPKPRRRR